MVLDVGCGDGLIAFGALDRVGEEGQVIFSDISQDLLDHCRSLAQQLQVLERCRFVRASAENLAAIATGSVDVVTTRSVLIYVQAKQQALHEFYHVLKPGGRLSIFEPINRFCYPEPPQMFLGYDVTPMNLSGNLQRGDRIKRKETNKHAKAKEESAWPEPNRGKSVTHGGSACAR